MGNHFIKYLCGELLLIYQMLYSNMSIPPPRPNLMLICFPIQFHIRIDIFWDPAVSDIYYNGGITSKLNQSHFFWISPHLVCRHRQKQRQKKILSKHIYLRWVTIEGNSAGKNMCQAQTQCPSELLSWFLSMQTRMQNICQLLFIWCSLCHRKKISLSCA